jgi:hypothetical protein
MRPTLVAVVVASILAGSFIPDSHRTPAEATPIPPIANVAIEIPAPPWPSVDFGSVLDTWAEAVARWDEAQLQAWVAAEAAARVEAERVAAQARVVPAPKRVTTAALPSDIAAIVEAAARRHGLDPALFAKIAWCESKGDPHAYNPSGASGLFQQLKAYWAGRAAAAGLPGADVFDPVANAEVSAWLMATSGPQHWNPSRSCWG